MKAVVTGGFGMQGAALASRLLETGHEVTVVDNRYRGKEAPSGASPLVLDLRYERPDLRGFDVVFHLAARVGGFAVTHGPEDCEIMLDNCLIDTNVLKSAAEARVRRFVYASTGSVYEGQGPNREEDSINKVAESGYTQAKLVGEAALQRMLRKGVLSNIAVLRLFNVYGPGEVPSHVIPDLTRAIRTQPNPLIRNPGAARSFLYVDDAVDAYIAASRGNYAGPVNVCSSEVVTIRELALLIKGSMGSKKALEFQEGSNRAFTGDPSLAARVLGWRAKTRLKDGLRKALEWELDVHPPSIR